MLIVNTGAWLIMSEPPAKPSKNAWPKMPQYLGLFFLDLTGL